MKPPRFMLIPLAVSLLFCFCPASELAFPPYWTSEPLKLVDGYGLATWSEGGYVLVGTLSVSGEKFTITSDITQIGWDDYFIILEEEMFTIGWIVIVVSTGQIYSCEEISPDNIDDIALCNSYEDFQALRTQLGVPENLEMNDIEKVYEELSQRRE